VVCPKLPWMNLRQPTTAKNIERIRHVVVDFRAHLFRPLFEKIRV
jgi:hypothetical protein